jgi:hypothetical protein
LFPPAIFCIVGIIRFELVPQIIPPITKGRLLAAKYASSSGPKAKVRAIITYERRFARLAHSPSMEIVMDVVG